MFSTFNQTQQQSYPTMQAGGYGSTMNQQQSLGPNPELGPSSGFGPTNAMGSDKSVFRSGPGAYPVGIKNMPSMEAYILLPWLCTVFIVLWAVLFHGMGFIVVILPALALCVGAAMLSLNKYRHEMERVEKHQGQPNSPYNDTWPQINLLLLILVASLIGGVVVIISYVCFYQPYDDLGGGATYLNMLATQPGAAAADATAIMFAEGTKVDKKRSYGFADARNTGSTYCVAPVSNSYSDLEPVIQFWAAGVDCCGAKGDNFGCGEGGSAKGAMPIYREDNAPAGYRSAVEGALAKHGLSAGTGYLLLNMVQDPMQTRQNYWSNALKLTLIFLIVYLLISVAVGYMAYNSSKGGGKI